MKLIELLNSQVPYTVTKESSGQFITTAPIGDRTIVFRAELNRDGDGEYWELSFEEKLPSGKVSYDKTGSGHEFKVLAMIKSSTIKFIEQYSPKVMRFTADASTRASIYRKIFKDEKYHVEERVVDGEHLFICRQKM